MPIRVGDVANWRTIQPTTDWKLLPWTAGQAQFQVATDLYYVNVAVIAAAGQPISFFLNLGHFAARAAPFVVR